MDGRGNPAGADHAPGLFALHALSAVVVIDSSAAKARHPKPTESRCNNFRNGQYFRKYLKQY